MINPKLDWYGRNELNIKRETSEPETISQIEPEITTKEESVALDVPNYPVTVESADELEVTEISEDDNKVTEEGE